MSYRPRVNDYVKWDQRQLDGWVYFYCEKYITIEMMVSPKDEKDFHGLHIHENNHLLVLCYSDQWKELTYIRSRKSIHEE
jgi:hypothetical protein